MTKRAVVIFPKGGNMASINDIRQGYDPLAPFIAPHITLVFPFESHETTAEIHQKLHASLRGQFPFQISLCGISKNIDSYGNYLFLNITHGDEKIKKLHDLLYRGFFNENRIADTYIPHITLGKLPSVDALTLAHEASACSDTFTLTVDAVSVVTVKETHNKITEIKQEILHTLS